MTTDEELSRGTIAYLQRGRAASPHADEDACAAAATAREPEQLVAEVVALVQESLTVPVDWDTLSLGDAGRSMSAQMGTRHPELSADALDALAWNFTFAWR